MSRADLRQRTSQGPRFSTPGCPRLRELVNYTGPVPEGNVIHGIAQRFSDVFGGRRVAASSPQGRFDASRLDGLVLERGDAVGKHLFIDFANGDTVHIHLGLIGKLRFEPLAQPWGQVRLRIHDGVIAADLRGPQWCRILTPDERAEVVTRSGPDPLRTDAEPGRGYERLHRSGKSIAALLMDQRITAGVGNIFRAEVLFRHGIDPTTPGRRINEQTWNILWQDLVDLMHHAVKVGTIDTVRDEHGPEAQARPPREDAHGGEVYVYRRAGQPCLVCGHPISISLLEGRNLYWCPQCQRSSQAHI